MNFRGLINPVNSLSKKVRCASFEARVEANSIYGVFLGTLNTPTKWPSLIPRHDGFNHPGPAFVSGSSFMPFLKSQILFGRRPLPSSFQFDQKTALTLPEIPNFFTFSWIVLLICSEKTATFALFPPVYLRCLTYYLPLNGQQHLGLNNTWCKVIFPGHSLDLIGVKARPELVPLQIKMFLR